MNNFIKISLPIMALFCLQSCKNEDSSAWSNFKPLNEIEKYTQGYYAASLGEASNLKNGNAAVYVDFSDGLIQAYSENHANGQIIQAITNKLVNPDIEWFALGSSKITKLNLASNQIYNKVTDPKEYKDIMAPIKGALQKITSSNNDALLITDFEEYTSDGKEQFENYPKEYFTNWLAKGNSITFFYTDYSEINKKSGITTSKHLYYTVFTHGKATETSMVSQIRNALKGRVTTKIFELNNSPYTISNDYGGKDKTGIANKTLSQVATTILNASADKNLPYEVIGIENKWDDGLDKYVQNIIQKEKGLFMNKLLLNASDQSSYKLKKIAVKVYDISDDFEKYARCNKAKNHIPVLTKNDKKDLVWDEKSKNDPITVECYQPNEKTIVPNYLYKSKDLTANEWSEVFDVDSGTFNSHLKNDPKKIELKLIFHKNYKKDNFKKEDALIRIDYIIEDVTFNDTNPQLNDFQWASSTVKGNINTSLSEAIRNTLQDPRVNQKSKILYSYFIKFGNTTSTSN
ncbi:hypothetical protein HNP99_003231 [Flavobacterium sp. 28A]|uniref:hypothetical protein n=1 Tax=Flavobacterium sp. 28A TaxID=2735895 RepID=UPI00157015C3|nr:hypothetical protein [Flavobacterium sp. 28A]NRT16857.1 hypothetical protein [Flavobacterium sp. 28A]